MPTRSPTLEHASSGDGLPTPHTNSLLHNDTRRRAVTPAPVTTPVTPVPSAARLRRVRKYFRESLDMAAAARSKRQRRTNSSPGPLARPTKLQANAVRTVHVLATSYGRLLSQVAAGVAVARRADAEDLGGHCHVLGPSCAHGFLAADRGHSTVLRSQASLDVSADDIAVASRLLGFPATVPRDDLVAGVPGATMSQDPLRVVRTDSTPAQRPPPAAVTHRALPLLRSDLASVTPCAMHPSLQIW